jgi:hypothetical protein
MKNWNAIKAIGQDNWSLMMALTEANPETDSGKKLTILFPECFNSTEDQPVPLSILRAYANLKNAKTGAIMEEGYIASEIFADLTSPSSLILPYEIFMCDENDAMTLNRPLIPKTLSPLCYIGTKVNIDGVSHVVIENEKWTIHLTPAQYIDVDIEPYPQTSEMYRDVQKLKAEIALHESLLDSESGIR